MDRIESLWFLLLESEKRGDMKKIPSTAFLEILSGTKSSKMYYNMIFLNPGSKELNQTVHFSCTLSLSFDNMMRTIID